MVRRKQTNPYHGTKENVDAISNTTPLVAEIISLPKRPFPPLLRFGILVNRSDNPEQARTKLLEEFDYRHEQGDDIQRSIQDMSLGDLKNTLQELGLKIHGKKKQSLVNRLIGAQARPRNGKGKEKGSRPRTPPQNSPVQTPNSTTRPEATEENSGAGTGGVKLEEANMKSEPSKTDQAAEDKRDEDLDEDAEDEDKDELSTSTSPYANLKVLELRTELRRRGLSCIGRKEELAERLEADDAGHREPAASAESESDGALTTKRSRGKDTPSPPEPKARRPSPSEDEDSQEDDDDDTDEYVGEEDGRGRSKRKAENKKNSHWRKKKRV